MSLKWEKFPQILGKGFIERFYVARKGRKRLTIDLHSVLYDQLILLAKCRNITLTRLISRLIVRMMKEERRYED